MKALRNPEGLVFLNGVAEERKLYWFDEINRIVYSQLIDFSMFLVTPKQRCISLHLKTAFYSNILIKECLSLLSEARIQRFCNVPNTDATACGVFRVGERPLLYLIALAFCSSNALRLALYRKETSAKKCAFVCILHSNVCFQEIMKKFRNIFVFSSLIALPCTCPIQQSDSQINTFRRNMYCYYVMILFYTCVYTR